MYSFISFGMDPSCARARDQRVKCDEIVLCRHLTRGVKTIHGRVYSPLCRALISVNMVGEGEEREKGGRKFSRTRNDKLLKL